MGPFAIIKFSKTIAWLPIVLLIAILGVASGQFQTSTENPSPAFSGQYIASSDQYPFQSPSPVEKIGTPLAQPAPSQTEGCLYANGARCTATCCGTATLCQSTQTYAYLHCDTRTGKWSTALFADSSCASSCASGSEKSSSAPVTGRYLSEDAGEASSESTPPSSPTVSPSPSPTTAPIWQAPPTPTSPPEDAETGATVIIADVIDGDTVRTANGEAVRLLGINAPEKGQPYFEEAKSLLVSLVDEKTVTLEADMEDKDRYGRLLRYIKFGNIFVNQELVRAGLAVVWIIEPNKKYQAVLLATEEDAKRDGSGFWASSNQQCIIVSYFHPFAEGNDNENRNDEYVTFRNSCQSDIDLSGWSVTDLANHKYSFVDFVLPSTSSVTLYTGSGTDTGSELYWNSAQAIWNNDGDTLYLHNTQGERVLAESYGPES